MRTRCTAPTRRKRRPGRSLFSFRKARFTAGKARATKRAMSERTNLLEFTLPAMTEWFAAQGEKPFRARQVFQWIHQRGIDDFGAMTDLAKSLREKLKAIAVVAPPAVLSEHRSGDGTVKWLFDVGRAAGSSESNGIETVFIPEEDRGTLCISSQVGCALDCKFCSTGRQGFNRDLKVGEIVGQLWVANQRLRELGATRLPSSQPSSKGGEGHRPVTN